MLEKTKMRELERERDCSVISEVKISVSKYVLIKSKVGISRVLCNVGLFCFLEHDGQEGICLDERM